MRKILKYQNLILFVLLTGMLLGGLPSVSSGQYELIDTPTHNYSTYQPGTYWMELQVTADPTNYTFHQADFCWVQLQVTTAILERWDFFEQSFSRDHRKWWWLFPKQTQSTYLVS